jgi:microcystin-dependent protein
MPTQLQFRRGTAAQNNSFTGAAGEISTDTSDYASIRVHDGSTAGGIKVLPSGMICMHGAATAPSGWILCEGAAVNRTTYSELFAVIGTTYGVGDGSTTFNVPDMRDRAPYGASTFTLGSKTGGEINASAQNSSGTGTTGAGTTGGSTTGTGTTGSGGPTTHSVTTATFATSAKDSSTSSAVTAVSDHATHTHSIPGLSVPGLSVPGLSIPALTITHPAVAVKFIIKI